MTLTKETDVSPDHITVWSCVAPAAGSSFVIVEDEWDYESNPPVRTVKEWVA